MNKIKLDEGFFPSPWNIYDHPEKTEGWIEFQKAMRKDPEYYSFQPERTSEGDQYVGISDKVICDVPTHPTKGMEPSRND